MSDQILEKIKKYLDGRLEIDETANKVAKNLEINQATARKYLKQLGVSFKKVETKKQNQKIPIEVNGKVYESILQASKATGIHPNTLHYRVSSYQKQKSSQRYQENKQKHHKQTHLAHTRSWGRKLLNLAQHRLRVNSHYKNLDFALSLEEMERLCESLDRCAICDQSYDLNMDSDISDCQPSLDRIDPTKGYTIENVRIVCYRCNTNHRSDLFKKQCKQCQEWVMSHSSFCHRCGSKLLEHCFEENWQSWLLLKERVLEGEKLDKDRRLKLFKELQTKETSKSKGNLIPSYKTGLLLVDSFFPNRFKARKSNEKSFFDWIQKEENMRLVIEKMTQDKVEIRAGLIPDYIRKVSKYKVARVYNFRPLTAREIIRRFGKEGDLIYDFSAGFGGRMIGAASAFEAIHYVGVDPNQETFSNLLKLKDFLLNDVEYKGKIEVFNQTSEEFLPSDLVGRVDIAFSSPPYFDLEQYSDELSQCYRRFPSYPLWKENYLRATIRNIHILLKQNGLFIVNIKNTNYNLADDLLTIAKEEMFSLSDCLEMELASRGADGRTEPIFVFKKMQSE